MSKYLAIMAAILLTACQSTMQKNDMQPALLVDTSDGALELVASHLAEALGKAQIKLGAMDLEVSNTIPVLPPRQLAPSSPNSPPEHIMSATVPTLFDLYISGSDCFAVRRDAGQGIPLPGVTCRPMPTPD